MIGDRIEVNIAGGLDFPLPRMIHVRQKFQAAKLPDVTSAIEAEFLRPEIRAKIRPGMSIAVGCGSRGVANIAQTAKAVVTEIKALGGNAFIFPAMGSHGAATAEGQRGVLEGYGITESYTGAPIRATMETVQLGALPDGTPVHMDKYAFEADGVVLINRVKPHTNFRGPIESGLVKMMTIGMGKIMGATALHTHGMDRFAKLLPEVARFILGKVNFLFGVGLVENAEDQTAIVEAIIGEELFEREAVLQARAKDMMGKLYFDEIDVLVIDEIGKNISGAGADPNITGRNCRFIEWDAKPLVKKIVMLGLTEETHGNAIGLGAADVITMKLYEQLDVAATYANAITSAYLDGVAIPLIMNTEREAIALAVKTVVRVKPLDCRIVRIRNTLELTHIQVSEPLLEVVRQSPMRFDILSAPTPFAFDQGGRLQAIAA